MTTTPNPTAEQVIDRALKDHKGRYHPVNDRTAAFIEDELLYFGLLSEGAPSEDDRAMQIAREIASMHTFTTVDALSIANAALALAAPPSLAQRYPSDEQVEAAARALWAGHGLNGEWESGTHEMHEDCREDARNALIAAAGVASQPLDPEKVTKALHILRHPDCGCGSYNAQELDAAQGFCEAYTEGELT